MTQKQRDEFVHNDNNWISYGLHSDSSDGSLGTHLRIRTCFFTGQQADVVMIRIQAKVFGEHYTARNDFGGIDPLSCRREEYWQDIHLAIEDEHGRWINSSWTGFKDAMTEADRKPEK